MSDAFREQVGQAKWFHSIDFGDFASSGRFPPGTPQNTTLYGVFEFLNALNLRSASLLDIGAYDGIVSYGASALGARGVFAVDTYENPCFLLARRILGLEDKVKYLPGYQMGELDRIFPKKTFDCVVCAGVIYHMLYPMQAYVESRKLLRDGGYLIMETPFVDEREDAVLVVNGVDKVVNEPSTYFVPTRAALTGMAALCGFKLVAERILDAPRRITLLLRVTSRAALAEDPQTPPFIVQMLKRDLCDNEFRFRTIEAVEAPSAQIGLTVNDFAEKRTIVARDEKVRFPYHPPRDRPTFGATRFETADGNTKVL